jgi:hypothetical protein
VENICTRTAISFDHLPVIFEVVTDVRREIPSQLVFGYKNVNWTHSLDFSLDRIALASDIDSTIQNFTEAILEARSWSVPLVRPNRHSRAQVYHLM